MRQVLEIVGGGSFWILKVFTIAHICIVKEIIDIPEKKCIQER
jgi:hypothetical protein